MKKSGSLYVILLAAGLLSLGWPLGADLSAAGPNPCSEDAAKFCGNVETGPAGMVALMECLEAHEKELSDACRDFEAGMGGPRTERRESVREKRQFRQSCMGDMAKYCQNAGPMQGGMMKCLDEHQDELSAPCSQSIKAMR
jgi:hypothetical protein